MKHLLITTIAAVVLVGCGSGRNIHDAAFWGNIEAVKQHLAEGADVNAKGEKGETPLHGAAFTGRMEVVELLIENGADVNAKDEDGGTPLLYVTLSGHKETADLLRKHGGKTGEELKAEGK
jgi:ankyrin repeat protein